MQATRLPVFHSIAALFELWEISCECFGVVVCVFFGGVGGGGAALFTLDAIGTFSMDGDDGCGDRHKSHAQDQVHLWLRNVRNSEKKLKKKMKKIGKKRKKKTKA